MAQAQLPLDFFQRDGFRLPGTFVKQCHEFGVFAGKGHFPIKLIDKAHEELVAVSRFYQDVFFAGLVQQCLEFGRLRTCFEIVLAWSPLPLGEG